MTRNMTKFVAVIATLSVALAASTALADKSGKGSGNGGGNGGNGSSNGLSFKKIQSNVSQGTTLSLNSSNSTNKFKSMVTSNNFASGQSGNQNSNKSLLKIDNIKKAGNLTNSGIKLGDLGINNGSKNSNNKSNDMKNQKKDFCDFPKNKCFPKDGCFPKDKCHDKCCHDWHKYHCWFPIWTYPTYPVYETVVVEKPVVIQTVATPVDLQLVDVRFGDVGDPASGLGPRYRITLRNVSPTAVGTFKVVAVAVAGNQPSPEAPPVFTVIESLQPGEVRSVDIRLPVGALTLARDEAGNVGPFSQLGVAIDADNLIPESSEENNRTILDRQQIPPITF